MKRKLGTILIILGLLSVLAGAGYGGFNLYRGERAGNFSKKTLVQLNEAKLEIEKPSTPEWMLFPEMEMPTIEIDGYHYIGTITIPDLDVELPVMADWSYPQLDISPCRYMGSAYLDNMILMSHDYPQHFGRTYQLQQGAKAIFTDVMDNVFEYELVNTEELYPTDVDILEKESDDYDLTIFACLYNGNMRTVGRFKRVSDK